MAKETSKQHSQSSTGALEADRENIAELSAEKLERVCGGQAKHVANVKWTPG